MELRNCSAKHFIKTIRGGLAIKVYNINANGRPVLQTKSLKDVYDCEDAKRLHKPASGSVFDNELAKHEGPCFLMADRTLREVKPEPYDSADGDLDSDLDDVTTLSQLKNRVFTKKRKHACTNEKVLEDESDLNEPLINLKKHSKAKMAKRKCLNPSVISSVTMKVVIKSEENLVSEGSEQAGVALPPLIHAKAGVPDAEPLGSQNEVQTASPAAHNEVLDPDEKTIVPEYDRALLSHGNIYEECLTSEICYAHLEDVQSISMLSPGIEASIRSENMESNCEESLGSALEDIVQQKEIPDSCSSVNLSYGDPIADLSCHYGSISAVEDVPEECSSGSQVPDMAIDCCIAPQGSKSALFVDEAEANLLSELDGSLSDPSENYSSSPDSITTSSPKENPSFMKDAIADEEQLSTSSCVTVMRDAVNSEGHTEVELLKALDKQNSEIQLVCTENESSLEDEICDDVHKIYKQEHHFPERLFSTRKAFSPSSEEQLCLAMNSAEIWENPDQKIDSGCKWKLFETQNGKKPSSLRSEVLYDNKTVNHRLSGQVNQQKFVRSPRRTNKRSQMAKGNLEGPRFSRTLPNLSTGCTSVQGCSESAVAFSQRQMHDMESVAGKLMTELKSMKDIVEQKLLFEAYRSSSLKNDADEVKSAISNAIRVEEMARKWMSTMARDCNRFCKIMKMTPDSTFSSKDTSPKAKGKRKIKFADEAGGELCHVRFFHDSTASPASDAVEQ